MHEEVYKEVYKEVCEEACLETEYYRGEYQIWQE